MNFNKIKSNVLFLFYRNLDKIKGDDSFFSFFLSMLFRDIIVWYDVIIVFLVV